MRVAAPALLLLSSCSWLFQDRLRAPNEGGYDGRSEPQCTDGNGLAAIDLILAALDVASLAVAVSSSDPNQQTYVGSSAIGAAVFGLSGLTGLSWASECTTAYKDWKVKKVELLGERQQRKRDAEEARDAVIDRNRKRAASVKQRGWYCASSPATSLCARERGDCERARSAMVAVAPDIGECTFGEFAFCFDAGGGDEDRCASTLDVCRAQQAAASVDSDAIGPCSERK